MIVTVHTRLVLSTLATVLLAAFAPAQEQQTDPTAEEIQQRRGAVEVDNSLDEAVRASALVELQKALDALSRAEESRTTAARYRREAEEAPTVLEQLQAELAKPSAHVEPEVERQWTAADVVGRRDQAQRAASDAEENLTKLEARAQRRSARGAAIEAERRKARAKLTEVRADLENPPEQPHPALTDAMRWRLLSERMETNAAIDRLGAEDSRNTSETEMVPLRVDLARRQLTVARATLESWETLLRARRSSEAKDAADAAATARGELATRHAPLRQVVDEIERLTAQLSGPDGVVAKRNAAGERQSIIDQTHERTQKSYADAAARYQAAGASSAFGLFLSLEYDKLPIRRHLRIEARQHKRDITDATYQALILRERRSQFGDVGARVADFLAGLPRSESATERTQLKQAATELFGRQRNLIGTLRTHYEDYVKELLRLDSSTERLLTVTESYEDFIREHILWVPSVEDPFALDVHEFRDSALWLLRGDLAREELSGLGRDVAGQWYLSALLAAIFGAALAARRRGVSRIENAAPLVQRYKTDTLSLSAQVLGWTLVAALPFPLLVLGAGQIVELNIGDSTWRLGWATVLARLAVFLVPAAVLLQTLRPNGLARVHFRWPDEPCRALSAALRRYAIPALVAGEVLHVLQYAGDPAYRESTGRLLGLVAMVLWGVFAWRVLAPKGPVLGPYHTRNPDSLITRSKVPIFLFGVGMPAALCVATVIGYFFTARAFGELLVLTYLLVFGLLLVHGLAMRWLFFHRRRLAVDQATQRRQEKEEQKAAEGAATEPEVDPDEDVDIPALHAHTRVLFRAAVVVALIVGLLSIWSETLPALKRLDRVQLWPSVRVLSTAETDAATAMRSAVPTESGDTTPGASAAEAPSIPGVPPSTAPLEMEGESSDYSLTLADLLAALVFGLVTIVVVRNVPALLEIGVLTRLPIDAGARYAIATLVRYLLIGVGATLTFGALGIGWSSIQWLAAALTFGLAFGLQEIFANFISGLILLVERPIRVGDTVTVDAVQGTIARIRTRATTILDYDNREHLIPNKSLITGSVINWTLTDTMTRVVVPVGVAYGSDVGRVFETLQRAGAECPSALANPAPSVLFTGYGDSSVNFALRVHIATRSEYVVTVNDILRRIDEGFRREGIEIPFPQRDLHLRSSDVELGRASGHDSTDDTGR